MCLIYLTLLVVGLVLLGIWYMYSFGVHGNVFRFHWNEWGNWGLITAILFCFGLPIRNLVLIARKGRSMK